MKLFLSRLAVGMLTGGVLSAIAPVLAADDAPPAPAWLKIIDQGDLNPRLKGYKTPEGVKVEIVAEDPVVVNPVEMAFAEDGALYVADRPHGPGSKDVVHLLSDATGKGVYATDKVVFEDEAARGLLLHGGWLYVCGRDMVRRYRSSKDGGSLDERQVVAQGLDVRGASVGPDGWLYLTAAAGDNDVEGSDGSRATVLRTGGVFRCRPDGSKVQTYAIGLMNPVGGVAFDGAGNLFQMDAGSSHVSDDRYGTRRLLHVAEGADFGYRTAGDSAAGQLPPMFTTGRGRSGGLLVYDDTRLPEKYRGLILAPDATRPAGQAVHAYRVDRAGATFAVVEAFAVLSSDDPQFRPRQALTGPDGAIYVVDSRDEGHGRILRLTWAGTKDQPALPPRGMDSWAKTAKLEDGDLMKALAGDDAGVREPARRELARRGEKERPALLKLLKDAEQPDAARVAALGALEAMWNGDVQAAALVLVEKDSSADLRRLAADALGLNAARGDDDVHSGLLQALNDVDPAVRHSVALAMSHVAGAAAPDNLVNAWSFEEGRDSYLRDGLVRAIENLGAPGIERLVALGESGVQKDTDKVVQAFTMMRTRPAADAVPRVLENPHLSAAQRAALLRSYGNYLLDPPLSPAPALDYLKAHPREEPAVKLAGLEVLTLLEEKDPAPRKEAIGVLAADADGAQFVGQAFLDKKLPPEALPEVADALRRFADKEPACAKLLAEVMKTAP